MISKKIIYYLLIPLMIVSTGCNNNEREKQLDQREQELLAKEKEFAKKEAEYQSLLQFRDSLAAVRDTNLLRIWPDSIAGKWNAKLVCTESNCNNYAVGDQRTDQWEFSSDSTNLLAKVTSSNQLVRVYTGSFENQKIALNFKNDATPEKQVEMNVDIAEISYNKMKGVRTIKSADNCVAVFSVELNRIMN